MLVAGRHGWPVGELSSDSVAGPPAKPKVDPRRQLVPPDPVIAEVLSADARRAAAGVRLPIITLAAGKRS